MWLPISPSVIGHILHRFGDIAGFCARDTTPTSPYFWVFFSLSWRFSQVCSWKYTFAVFTARCYAETTRTRKPCYRKDDRAMRPLYGCPEKFRESSQTPPATFPEFCKKLFFRSILRMCIQNLKFVALSVPEIIGVLKKFGQSLDTPTLHFLSNF